MRYTTKIQKIWFRLVKVMGYSEWLDAVMKYRFYCGKFNSIMVLNNMGLRYRTMTKILGPGKNQNKFLIMFSRIFFY